MEIILVLNIRMPLRVLKKGIMKSQYENSNK